MFTLEFIILGEDNFSFAIAGRYGVEQAKQYERFVAVDICRDGFSKLEILPGVLVPVESVRVVDEAGVAV